jgi:DNA-binding HxlR family transcriptional regulator
MASVRKTKDFNPFNCPVTHCMNKIGGKWKMLIIYGVYKKCNRFSMLQKAIPMISKQMLVNQLRELEADGLLERMIYAEIPPRVEYKLTAQGQTLLPVISVLQDWGTNDMKATAQ